MADFIAVEDAGHYATGYLVANGNIYPAVSGVPGKYMDCPPGDYRYGKAMDLDGTYNNRRLMTDATTDKEATKERATRFKKFPMGVAGQSTTTLKDKRTGKTRRYIRLHYTHFGGTAGCIGYMDNAAMDALSKDPDKSLHVEYVKSIREAQNLIKARLKARGQWRWGKKFPAIKAPGTGVKLAGIQSETGAMAKVEQGDDRVLVGPKQRELAHRSAPVEGGFEIAEGSRNVFVGPERHPVSAVSHMTTDGTPLESGEPSVEIGLIG